MDKINIPKLKGRSNWTMRKLQIMSALQYHDFEGILSGQLKEPDPLPVDATEQQRKVFEASKKNHKKANGYGVSLITITADDELLQLVLMSTLAKEMWDKLCLSYEQKSE